MLRADDDGITERVWIVGTDGRELRRIPDVPERTSAASHFWLGWSPDGDALYLYDRGLWRVEQGEFRALQCASVSFGCPLSQPTILPSGLLVGHHLVSEGNFPGSQPTSQTYLVVVDPELDDATVLGVSTEMRGLDVGEGPVAVVTEVSYNYDDNWQVINLVARTVMYAPGERVVLEDPAGPWIFQPSPVGDLVVWHAEGAETTIRDLDGRVLHVIGRPGPLQWAPDAATIVGEDRGRYWLYDLDEERMSEIEPGGAARLAYWAPTGRHLALEIGCPDVMSDRVGFEIYEKDGDWVEVASEPCAAHAWGGWSADASRYAIATTQDGIAGFRSVDMRTGARGPFVEGRPLGFRPR